MNFDLRRFLNSGIRKYGYRQFKIGYITGVLMLEGIGEGRIRTSEGVHRQIYSLFPLAAREPHLNSWREELNPQHADYKSAALPIELRQQICAE